MNFYDLMQLKAHVQDVAAALGRVEVDPDDFRRVPNRVAYRRYYRKFQMVQPLRSRIQRQSRKARTGGCK